VRREHWGASAIPGDRTTVPEGGERAVATWFRQRRPTLLRHLRDGRAVPGACGCVAPQRRRPRLLSARVSRYAKFNPFSHPTSLDFRPRAEEYARQIRETGARFVLVDNDTCGRVIQAAKSVEWPIKIITFGDLALEGATTVQQLLDDDGTG
jgi:hypothetical protein